MAQEDEQDEAARAFESLRAAVTVMRRTFEALEAKKPTGYAPTLSAPTQELERLTAAATAMVLTPESYAAQLRRATDEAAWPAAAELQRVQTLTGTLERDLGGSGCGRSSVAGSARRDRQDGGWCGAGPGSHQDVGDLARDPAQIRSAV